jgi:PAS domain S-box-containing protein
MKYLCFRKYLYIFIIKKAFIHPINMQNLRKLLKYIVVFTIIFRFSCVFSQPITDNQLKAGYIYSFLKNVSWENENLIDTFQIAIYGDDEAFINVLKEIEKLKAKEKPIKVKVYKSISEITNPHILYITNDRNYFIKDVFDLISGRNTLMITDRYEFQRYVMINFLYSESSKIQFEINTKNLEDARFKSSPKLILLGGNEIDVRRLYVETEKSLISEKEKSGLFEKELLQKKEEVQIMNLKIYQFYKEIEGLQGKINNHKTELNSLKLQSKEQEKSINQKNRILLQTQQEIKGRELQLDLQKKQISQKQQQLESYSKILSQKKAEVNRQQETINKQDEALLLQVEKIKTQQTFLYFLLALSALILSLVFVIYRSYKLKREKNYELEKINIELNKKKDKIAHQANQLEIKNIELEKLSIVASETINAVMIMNGNGDFEWANEGFSRLYGYTLNEFIEQKGSNLLQTSTYKNIKEIFEVINTEKKSVAYEAANINYEGKPIWIHSTLTPILDENKNIRKLIVIDSDITQLKEAELDIINKNEEIQRQSEELFKQAEHLLILNKELELRKNILEDTLEKLKSTQSQLVESEKMVILGQLTAGIAHEINNPINFINSGIEGLKQAFEQIIDLLNKYEQLTPENAKQKIKEVQDVKKNIDYSNLLIDVDQLTKDIKSGVIRTIEIIKGLRTFSRLDENDLKKIDLHSNIDSTLVILRNKYINKIEVEKQYGDIPEVECYPGKINQVLLNIIVNAVQAIENEGRIFISTELSNYNNTKCILLKIRDTGKGMTEDIKKKIFEPFYTTKEAGEGTGLGLSISFSIIENHCGAIKVDSEPGEGTTFSIYLPVVHQKKSKSVPVYE